MCVCVYVCLNVWELIVFYVPSTLNPGPSHGSPLRYRCATQAPLYLNVILKG